MSVFVDLDIEDIDVGEYLKEQPFPSMTGLAASGPMFPRPSNSRAIRDHRDQVSFGGVLVSHPRLIGDAQARFCYSGRIGEERSRWVL